MEDKRITITKEFVFDSSHRLISEDLTDEENKEVFGKCYNFPSHGHTYHLFVTVSGIKRFGMIMNFTDLKRIVKEKVVDVFDHHYINDLDCMRGIITTCENQIQVIWGLLEKEIKDNGAVLEKLKLYETPTSFAELVR